MQTKFIDPFLSVEEFKLNVSRYGKMVALAAPEYGYYKAILEDGRLVEYYKGDICVSFPCVYGATEKSFEEAFQSLKIDPVEILRQRGIQKEDIILLEDSL